MKSTIQPQLIQNQSPMKNYSIFNFNADTFANLAQRSNGFSQKVYETLQQIIDEHYSTNGSPGEEGTDQVYLRFIDCPPNKYDEEFNTASQVRKLAWLLTYSEQNLPRIVDTPQLQNVLELIDNRFRISTLLGIFDTLLQAWDSSEANTDSLRAFIEKYLKNYDGPLKFIQKLKTNIAYFTLNNGPSILVEDLLHSQKNLSDLYSVLELPNCMYSYSYFRTFTTTYISSCTLSTPLDVAAIVEFVKKHNDEKMICQFLSQLIQKLGVSAEENLRQPMQSYILKNWGDPRTVDVNIRWHGIFNEARNIFRRWIMKEDISFFFDVVVKTRSNRKFYRKDYWLQYFGKIDSCRIVLSENTRYLFRHDQYYQQQKYSMATLKDSKRDQHALIIQMSNHTYITFFPTELCYIYDNADLSFHLNDAEFSIHELRNKPLAKDYEKLETWINSEIGVGMLAKSEVGKW